jgi:hypothetical protein
LAVVNSEEEAEVLRCLYYYYGPNEELRGKSDPEKPVCDPIPPEFPNETVHIGIHDIFIEGEYLSVRSK